MVLDSGCDSCTAQGAVASEGLGPRPTRSVCMHAWVGEGAGLAGLTMPAAAAGMKCGAQGAEPLQA